MKVLELDVVSQDGEVVIAFGFKNREISLKEAKELSDGFAHFTVEFLHDVEEKRIRMEFKKENLLTNDIEVIDSYANEVMDMFRVVMDTSSNSDADDILYSEVHNNMLKFLNE